MTNCCSIPLLAGLISSVVAHRTTVTIKSQLFVLPQQSVATQCTVFVVLGANIVPEGGVQTKVTLGQQLSVAVNE